MRNISFAICSILISCLILYNLRSALRLRLDNVRTFNRLVLINLVASVSTVVYDSLIYFTDSHVPILAGHLCNLIYMFTHIATVPYLMLYLISLVACKSVPTKGYNCAIILAAGLYILLLLTNYWTGFLFTIEENGMYHRGSLAFFNYVITLYFVMILLVYQYENRKKLPYSSRITVLYTLLFAEIAAVIQFFFPRQLIETCVISIGLMILFFKVQNPMFMMHPVSGAFSRQAFADSLRNRECSALAVLLPDFSLVERTFGGNSSDLAMAEIVRYLTKECGTPCVYCVSDDAFCVLLNDDSDPAVMAKRILKRFTLPWCIGESDTLLAVKVCCVQCPKDCEGIEDFDNILTYISRNKSTPKFSYARDLDFAQITRDKMIEEALIHVVAENRVQLEFIPIYSTVDKSINALRVHAFFTDNNLGYVGQDEFLPCADRCGKAAAIDSQIFDKVCDYIRTHDLKAQGIHHVFKEILPYCYMSKGMADRVSAAFQKRGVDMSMICAVIREEEIAITSDDCIENLRALDRKGLKLCLADYGAGYSDVSVIFDIPFTMIFINRAVIAAAAAQDKANAMLESTVSLIRQMGLMVGASGADSKDLFDLTLDMGCDYVSGCAIDAPVPELQITGNQS